MTSKHYIEYSYVKFHWHIEPNWKHLHWLTFDGVISCSFCLHRNDTYIFLLFRWCIAFTSQTPSLCPAYLFTGLAVKAGPAWERNILRTRWATIFFRPQRLERECRNWFRGLWLWKLFCGLLLHSGTTG